MADPKAVETATLTLQRLARGWKARKKNKPVIEALAALKAESSPSAPQRAPFVPTSNDAIAAFLKLAQVTLNDTVLDIGCGDGRVLHAALPVARRVIGLENDKELVHRARKALAGDEEEENKRVDIRLFDLNQDHDQLRAILGQCTVVFIFMLPQNMAFLRTMLRESLPRGARVVSSIFRLDDPAHPQGWKVASVVHVNDNAVTPLYLYMNQ